MTKSSIRGKAMSGANFAEPSKRSILSLFLPLRFFKLLTWAAAESALSPAAPTWFGLAKSFSRRIMLCTRVSRRDSATTNTEVSIKTGPVWSPELCFANRLHQQKLYRQVTPAKLVERPQHPLEHKRRLGPNWYRIWPWFFRSVRRAGANGEKLIGDHEVHR